MQMHFKDLDSFETAAKGWGLEFVQLDRGPLDAVLALAHSDRVLITNSKLSRAFHQQGEAPLMGRTFGFYARPSAAARIRWLDGQFAEHTLAVFPVDGAYESHSAPGMDVFAITISQQYLEEVSEITGLQNSVDALPRTGSILICRPIDIADLRNAAFAILKSSERQQIAAREPEFDLTLCILKALAGKRIEQIRPTLRNRDKAYAASIELIRENSRDSITISDLCKSVGASERTLRYAFLEKLGVPPKTYLSAVRLNRVRSQLLQAEAQNSSVLNIALDQGFWHMGQFAADYRRLFGERPSDTLKRGYNSRQVYPRSTHARPSQINRHQGGLVEPGP